MTPANLTASKENTANTSPRRSSSQYLIAILVLAIVIRLLAAFLLGDNAAPVSGAHDQFSYDTLAQRVLAGNGFSFPRDWYPFTKANEPTAHWSFLYTLYLAAVYVLFGHQPLAARVIQVLASGISIWLTYRIGRRLFGDAAGLAAAALAGGYSYLIFFNAALMTQTFYILSLLLSFDLAMIIMERHSSQQRSTTRLWLVLGLVLGIGTLLRQTLLLFAPILFAWVFWSLRRKRITANRSLITGALGSLSIIAALILPWTVRNYLAFHDILLLNSNSGYWFYASNHPNQGTNFNPNFAPPIPDRLQGLPEPVIDRALFAEAVNFILVDPKRFLVLTLSRTKNYFWILPSSQSSLTSNLGRLIGFTLYLPFMLYGLWLSRKHWRECLLLYLYVGFDTILHLISWSAPRYRLPSDAVLMTFAGLALVSLAAHIKLPYSFSSRYELENRLNKTAPTRINRET